MAQDKWAPLPHQTISPRTSDMLPGTVNGLIVRWVGLGQAEEVLLACCGFPVRAWLRLFDCFLVGIVTASQEDTNAPVVGKVMTRV